MEPQHVLDALNSHAPGFLKMLGGQVVAASKDARSCIFEFDIGKDYCHSIDVVQGGFVTAMLDAAMSHAVFVCVPDIVNVSSLEIKTSYLAPTRAGVLRVEGYLLSNSYRTAFMEGKIYNAEGELTATSSSVGKIVRNK